MLQGSNVIILSALVFSWATYSVRDRDERETGRDTERHRQINTQRKRNGARETETNRDRQTDAERERQRQTDSK